MKNVEERKNQWITVCNNKKESLKKIIEEQKKDEQDLREKVIQVIKEEQKLVRNTVETQYSNV
ncbi:hypothetical protein E2C01_063405 [Portunus trituberculatus]|uniref:Uncharacterized protein n=1 Tax=Portunus trituberculatus TaxID=210409 RepID=A0A5B7HAD8_PORTR|nr:hypothetical protein [Portunus trituberculatus]